ncbi:hypothetical protein [Planococcus lenghuensis]|uniref:hypothetical protein n=1 Tax=Planococcus lenghuensis TaxID=2213202 RepID=UPI00098568CB|nr:hypothetical protein [Planococcus lenghuensis]
MKKCLFSNRMAKNRLPAETVGQLTQLLCDFNRLQCTAYQSQIRDLRLQANGVSVTYTDSLHIRMKKQFGLNDYYTNSAIQNAKALISSQNELKNLYRDQAREKIRKLRKKLKQVRTKRTQTQTIKDSLRAGNLKFPKQSHWQRETAHVSSASTVGR